MTKEEKNAYMRQYRLKNKAKIKQIRKKNYEKHKENNKAANREYYYKNKERIRAKIQQWSKDNETYVKQKSKEWYQKNKETVKQRVKTYQKNRRQIDPVFKLKTNLRTMITNLLKNRGFTKRSNTFNIVSCSFGEFIFHIESKFESWMDWDNYGKYNGELNFGWDIDHIIPMSTAQTEEDVIRLNHYSNLQPLCSKINRDIKKNS